MTVHIVKLCVGVDSVDDLEHWIEHRQHLLALAGEPQEHIHTTRMTPKRREELLDGGSLYWVIKGMILARQPIIDLRQIVSEDGISRCQIVMEPTLIRTESQPKRAFQAGAISRIMKPPKISICCDRMTICPADFRRELAELGLL